MVGVDGFIFNTTALYKIEAGHQWFVQVLYSIGPNFRVAQTNKNEYLGFQENSMNKHKVVKRSAIFGIDGDFDSETENAKNGSSLRGITLQNTEFDTNSRELEKRDLIWLAIVGVLLVVIKCVFNELKVSVGSTQVCTIQVGSIQVSNFETRTFHYPLGLFVVENKLILRMVWQVCIKTKSKEYKIG